MIQILARIASHTARGIYSFLLWRGGISTRKELLEAGYTSTIIHEAIIGQVSPPGDTVKFDIFDICAL
jgi:hypothetical protein